MLQRLSKVLEILYNYNDLFQLHHFLLYGIMLPSIFEKHKICSNCTK